MDKSFETVYCKGDINVLDDYDVIINATITDKLTSDYVSFVAPAPCDRGNSFSGSCLPFANKEQAFYNTPNAGQVKVSNNEFTIKLSRPNSYYSDFNTLQKPHVQFVYNGNRVVDIELNEEKIAYRSLQYPELRTSSKVDFYNRKLPIRSQEQILRDSEYNERKEHHSFWGLKPPC